MNNERESVVNLTPYLDLTSMIVLATIDENGNPYTVNMYYKVDKEYNFYFKSKQFREHSKHIVENNLVGWSVINTERYIPSSKDKKGLQFQ